MTEPVFRQVAGTLYALEPRASLSWIGFRAGQASGDSVTLSGAWQDATGVYVILTAAPKDVPTFRTALDRALANLPTTVRCLWVDDPTVANWNTQTLLATASGTGNDIRWSLTRNATFPHGNYSFFLARNTALTPGQAPTYGIAADAAGASFAAPLGSYPAEPGSVVALPFSGPATGAWTASLRLPGTSDDMRTLGVGLRYAHPAPTGSAVRSVRMPILRQEGKPVAMTVSFDPLRPRDPDRTNLTFVTDGAPALLSAFITTRGYDVHLAPTTVAPLPPARLVFNGSPVSLPASSAYQDPYLTPDGTFSLTAGGTDPMLELGPSGVEAVPVAGGATALFVSGQPAWAPGAGADLLTAAATTAHVTVLPPGTGETTGLAYRAQPPNAPLFGTGSGAFLDHQDAVGGRLPTYARVLAGAPTLPVGGYRWLDPAAAADARAIERVALAPTRRALIPAPSGGELADLADTRTVTPQGLLVTLDSTGGGYSSVAIAALPDELRITGIQGPLTTALQADQVFFVVADADAFVKSASVPFQLTELQVSKLPVDQTIRTAVANALRPDKFREYETEDAFAAVVKAAAGAKWDVVRDAAARFAADLQGWNFQLWPRAWRPGTAGDSRTVMIAKYATGTLRSLVADPARWSWQDAAGNLNDTKDLLERLFMQAEAAPAGSDLAKFSADIVNNAAWNGVLFLNAPVVLSQLPDGLRFVSAGIDQNLFYAHHIAFALTPVDTTSGAPKLGKTAVAALIRYDSPGDLVLSANVPFAFKTLALNARFENAALVGFSAQVELMVNQLFGAELRKLDPERGNNLVLDGSYQVQHGLPVYLFALRGVNEYLVARSALQMVSVTSVRMATATTDAGSEAAEFILSGALRFTELAGADLFSYDELRYTGLRVRMQLSPVSFASDDAGIGFDTVNSTARPHSFVANFPARVTKLVTVAVDPTAPPDAPPRGPETLGYAAVLAPIDSSLLSPPWYGLVLTVDLGTVGALAGGAGMSTELLVAWSPGQTDSEQPVYLGANAGGAIGKGWPLQGVLRLGFRSFQLLVADTVRNGVPHKAYGLRLRKFALTALWWSFPPGEADLYVFGDPDGDPSKAIGWYAAYTGPPPATKPALPIRPTLSDAGHPIVRVR